jgi:hypothetical protein
MMVLPTQGATRRLDLTPEALAACIADRWSPQIGDPGVVGWMTVVAYLATAALALRVAARLPGGRARVFWAIVAGLMLCLAVNKQLDLQSALTAAGRCISKAQGWYDDRKGVQVRFIVWLLGAVVLGLVSGLILLRRDIPANLLALVGLVFVAGFVLIRAVGFHHVDAFLGSSVHDVRVNWILEWTGLVLISVNALFLGRRRTRSTVTSSPAHRSADR